MYSRHDLYRLAREGKLVALKGAVSKEDLASKCPFGWTLLTYACMSGHVDVVRYLLEIGADPNVTGDGWVPLHEAANRGFEAIVKLLLEFGADPDVCDDMTPLHLACTKGFVEVAETLVDMGADVNAQDESGLTALHRAAVEGSSDIARHLVENGADIMAGDNVGWIPLDFAIDRGREEVVKVLLDAGCDVNSVDLERMMPLHHAANGGAVSVVRVLLEYGADVTATIGGGWTVLHEACDKGHLDVVEILLSSGARPSDATTDGWTALHEACRKNNLDMVAALLQWGANPNAATTDKWTPLHEACANGAEPVVRTLLQSGANPKACDRRRYTPLYVAGTPSIVSLLLDYRTDYVSPCAQSDSIQFLSCYERSRSHRTHLITSYERHFIKMETAHIRLEDGIKAKQPPALRDWDSSKREAFRVECQRELTEMSSKLIDGSDTTYADVLYQRPSRLRQIESLTLDDCRAWFPIYGDTIHARFVLSRLKMTLIERSIGIFSLTSLPRLPPECIEAILVYLDVADLHNVAIICERRKHV